MASMKRQVIFAAAIALSALQGCTPPSGPDARALAQLAPTAQRPLDLALWSMPELSALRYEYIAATEAPAIAAAGRKGSLDARVGAGASAGGRSDPTAAGQLSLTYAQVLADGGRTSAAVDEAELQVEIARLTYLLTANDILSGLAYALIDEENARLQLAALRRNQSAYRERQRQLELAARAGALTNSDLLQIETAINGLDAQIAGAQAQHRAAQQLIASATRGWSADAVAGLRSGFARRNASRVLAQPNWRARGLELGQARAAARLRSVLIAGKPVTALKVQATAPDGNSFTPRLSLGVTVDIPLYDAGVRAARARAAAARSQARTADLQAQARQSALAQATYRQAIQDMARQERLLNTRLRLGRAQIKGTEDLLRAGRADITGLVTQIVSVVDSELAVIALRARQKRALVDLAQARGASCALFQACSGLRLGDVE